MKNIIINTFVLMLIVSASACVNKEKNTKSENKEDINITQNHSDVFYHYSIWWAFVNKVFEGDITAGELKTKGDMALGSYNLLDGELIMLDGKLYQAKEDGEVLEPNDSLKVVYANAAFFDVDGSFKIQKAENYDTLRARINEQLPSKNFFYGFKIKGHFKYMKCGGLNKQTPPFQEGLDVLIPNRPIFERENFSGTMVGFYCPEFIGNINVAGFHFHFVSEDETFAGHVMEFEAENLTVEYDKMHEYQFVLPQTEAYDNVGFDKEFQYKKK
ncbi:acetolactate decarboxylase [Litoribaculum gwangyangense]|uniref:Alpha-acetolactate decarboxylase n=1 Tax=Litoribaculum gwangyangense TaxID=1130722 RepID=A0ABP9CTQ1_9FLAO